MDANEYALKVTPAHQSLGLAIRKAQWLRNGKAPAQLSASPALQLSAQSDTLPLDPPPSFLAAEVAAPLAADAAECSEKNATKTETLPAAVLPLAPACEVAAEMVGNEVVVLLGDRRYRVRGWERTGAINQLKLNLMVSCGDLFYVDSFDLYLSRPRLLFARHAAMDLGVSEEVIRKDLGRLLLQLEALRDAQVQNTETDKVPKASEEEEAQALALLRDPDLVGQILSDFAGMGMVGEDTNKLMGYLACVSRKLSQPLALIIQSTSAAGKSTLMEAILKLMPEEERIQYSAMTGQSLFYMGETDLKHKILAISEEEGVAQAAYALKLLQSEGELTIASTGKDAGTGNLITREYRVEGPVMLFLTTTAIDIDEELLNRCVVLTVNESREQTQAIHVAQRRRRTLEGLKTRQQHQTILGRHRHAQRLLRRLAVVNPYADQLTFLDDKTRTRRDHEKYLTLIDSIALLHQYQREVKVLQEGERRIEYIEVERRDIELANRLANEVLGRTLDELPPQTRKLLGLIEAMVSEGCARERIKRDAYRFSRRQIREQTGWGNTQLKVHLGRLEELEYLLIHKGGRGQSLEYELLYEGQGQDGTAFLMKLMDVNALHYEGEKSGVEVNLSGLDEPQSAPGRGQVGPESGGCREAKIPAQALNDGAFAGKEWHGVPEALLVVQREESIRSGQRWGDRG
jgi:energy-coupling factor transporter ATP-binding protein EcfA2